ncbi:GvpL/GvpF family gas vesicle protein [Virgibacillus halodenitrificans]|uniref:GvpL/GvpF family gas vesicle protein n=1 Tax=Virgibacillus halodenitrificans TaxID=1482 RepID=UPI00045C95F8|nr:GvpL/GvpF family gas vesicle protein [Virgibacillus halodenitrificans]CDQ37630.1 Gas vesicle synthesis protein GvpL/GvpF [Virgibacillus halodenitrificans]
MEKKVYLYGLIPTSEYEESVLPEKTGFDEKEPIYALPLDEITAIICNLDGNVYTESLIEEKMNNDLEWLQHKAFHHHEVLMLLNKLYTVIPLSFCTIYNNEASLTKSILSQMDNLTETISSIYGKEEWNVKVFSDDEILKKKVSENNPTIEDKRKEISSLSPGRQFFEKKKLDQLVERELEKEREQLCMQIHDDLTTFAVQADVKKNWDKKATGRKDSMGWNSVYLLEKNEVTRFLDKVKTREQKMGELGLQMEATGPWPAYHFSRTGQMEK